MPHPSSPEGTAEFDGSQASAPVPNLVSGFSRPFGTGDLSAAAPRLKAWAIFEPPSGRQLTNRDCWNRSNSGIRQLEDCHGVQLCFRDERTDFDELGDLAPVRAAF